MRNEVVSAMAAAFCVVPTAAQAQLARCPASPSAARTFLLSLPKLRSTGGNCGMFVPCAPSTLYGPGSARPYGFAPVRVSWEEGLGVSKGTLEFLLSVSKERAIAGLQAATKSECRPINSFSCIVRGASGGNAALSVKLEYLGGPSSSVTLVCQYW